MENVVIDAPGKLGRIVVGMNKVLGEIPVTVKLRTGVKEGKNTAHKLMPRVADWGASCLTVRHYSSLFESFFYSCSTVTWENSTTTLHSSRRLGLHPAVC